LTNPISDHFSFGNLIIFTKLILRF